MSVTSPLRLNIHTNAHISNSSLQIQLVLQYPPKEYPNWNSGSPTLNKLRLAGLNPLLDTKVITGIHLHNHIHRSETRPEPRNAPLAPGKGRWPGDSKELCDELERQATEVICKTMKQRRPYAMVVFGEYARDWFEECIKNGAFSKALGYDFQLEDVTFQVSETPNRYVEAKVFRPRELSIIPTAIAVFPNSAAFLAHHALPNNDCIGKALRLVSSTVTNHASVGYWLTINTLSISRMAAWRF